MPNPSSFLMPMPGGSEDHDRPPLSPPSLQTTLPSAQPSSVGDSRPTPPARADAIALPTASAIAVASESPPAPLVALSPAPDPQPSPDREREKDAEAWGHELMLYGHEQLMRASDHSTLVAFAAIAFQEIRGDSGDGPGPKVGCALLLLSVLMCAFVHFAMGHAFMGRARRLIRRRRRSWGSELRHGLHVTLAWLAALTQFGLVIVGTMLVLMDNPPAPLPNLVTWWEQGVGKSVKAEAEGESQPPSKAKSPQSAPAGDANPSPPPPNDALLLIPPDQGSAPALKASS
ncbi:hypothetical protein Isop_2270 [Isosphaera pallida ATCC 43644]|uniref:Uncharacterized protein n=1 Tax=Isosphaera pallida (strain ATCC 43644 / DSM 9630 / IS1B) TaxID=575540 RepID=E8R5U1_ISOPI|nr:hypothetical protein [Isosphaera pallida]ADV62848.1 hypothetical protein Isop_2270 [Isosphaera pallida ATCC 43644]